jgi:hypothetical protein
MGLTRFDYVRLMAFQSTNKFLPSSRCVLVSLLFIDDKFGDLSLWESESPDVTGSATGYLPPAPVRVGHVNEAQLRPRSNALEK